jgi:6-phosphogluconolactonase
MDEMLIQKIADEITEQAKTRKVLYLASGGSSIPVSVAVLKSLSPETMRKLTLTLTDERYGNVGHPDSNWQQLKDVGLDTSMFSCVPVLPPGELEKEEVAEHFEEHLSALFKTSPYIIALFGIGADSHIAGILPDSDAVKEEKHLVAVYDAGAFTRITITPPVFHMIDSAYVYARGESKRAAVDGIGQELPFVSFPNQLVKWCGHYSVSYNQ